MYMLFWEHSKRYDDLRYDLRYCKDVKLAVKPHVCQHPVLLSGLGATLLTILHFNTSQSATCSSPEAEPSPHRPPVAPGWQLSAGWPWWWVRRQANKIASIHPCPGAMRLEYSTLVTLWVRPLTPYGPNCCHSWCSKQLPQPYTRIYNECYVIVLITVLKHGIQFIAIIHRQKIYWNMMPFYRLGESIMYICKKSSFYGFNKLLPNQWLLLVPGRQALECGNIIGATLFQTVIFVSLFFNKQ